MSALHPYRALLVLLLTMAVLALARPASAQERIPAPEPRLSPMVSVSTMLNPNAYVRVVYNAPRIRDPETGEDREIFGGLVPYGEVWRFGANEATELITTAPILFGTVPLEAGTYTLFAIPGEEEWTIIINDVLGQAGTAAYDATNDVGRVEVPVEHIDELYEAFTINFEEADAGVVLNILWAQTKVSVPIQAR